MLFVFFSVFSVELDFVPTMKSVYTNRKWQIQHLLPLNKGLIIKQHHPPPPSSKSSKLTLLTLSMLSVSANFCVWVEWRESISTVTYVTAFCIRLSGSFHWKSWNTPQMKLAFTLSLHHIHAIFSQQKQCFESYFSFFNKILRYITA